MYSRIVQTLLVVIAVIVLRCMFVVVGCVCSDRTPVYVIVVGCVCSDCTPVYVIVIVACVCRGSDAAVTRCPGRDAEQGVLGPRAAPGRPRRLGPGAGRAAGRAAGWSRRRGLHTVSTEYILSAFISRGGTPPRFEMVIMLKRLQ